MAMGSGKSPTKSGPYFNLACAEIRTLELHDCMSNKNDKFNIKTCDCHRFNLLVIICFRLF